MRLTWLLLVLALAVPRGAAAYPVLQLSTGAASCQACHFSPSGGGLINDYGRDEAGSTFSPRGDGRFFHGLWQPPSWLALGADLRTATLAKRHEGRSTLVWFPMQADAYARASFGAWSVNLTAGFRGVARDPAPEPQYRVASREHYVMYQREPGDGVAVRLGRFFPTFGLRGADHTAYVRRYLGQHTLEEPYALAMTHHGERGELHAALFAPQPVPLLGAGPPAWGGAAYYERRELDDTAAWAAQAKLAITEHDVRAMAGAVGKLWLPSAGLAFQAEVDLVRQSFDAGAPRWQLAGYASATRLLLPGWMLGAAAQLWDPDLALRSSARGAFEANVQYLPMAHLELHWLGRIEAAGNDFDRPAFSSLLQLHYYL